jgi:hypothetical protein
MRDLRIGEPCQQDWDAMGGEGATRFCGACRKHVHDLSARTEAEARTLLEHEPEEGYCLRYRCDPRGLIQFVPGTKVRGSAPLRGGLRLPLAGALTASALVTACSAISPPQSPATSGGTSAATATASPVVVSDGSAPVADAGADGHRDAAFLMGRL